MKRNMIKLKGSIIVNLGIQGLEVLLRGGIGDLKLNTPPITRNGRLEKGKTKEKRGEDVMIGCQTPKLTQTKFTSPKLSDPEAAKTKPEVQAAALAMDTSTIVPEVTKNEAESKGTRMKKTSLMNMKRNMIS